jgi:hypothetical protein
MANARQRGLRVSVTYADFVRFTNIKQCHYCEGEIAWQPFYTKKGVPGHQKYFLDRKDNERGYDKDNLVVCCTFCNMVRGARFTYLEFLVVGLALKLVRLRREAA